MSHSFQHCRALWDGAVIHFSGRVYPCDQLGSQSQMEKMMLGDIKDQPLKSILDGERASHLRERMLNGSIEGLLCVSCDKSKSCNFAGEGA